MLITERCCSIRVTEHTLQFLGCQNRSGIGRESVTCGIENNFLGVSSALPCLAKFAVDAFKMSRCASFAWEYPATQRLALLEMAPFQDRQGSQQRHAALSCLGFRFRDAIVTVLK